MFFKYIKPFLRSIYVPIRPLNSRVFGRNEWAVPYLPELIISRGKPPIETSTLRNNPVLSV